MLRPSASILRRERVAVNRLRGLARFAVSPTNRAANAGGAFVVQAVRGLLGETDVVLREGRILLCDRDPNWTSAMEAVLSTVGVRVVGRRRPRRTVTS
jgi:hypothetical protein